MLKPPKLPEDDPRVVKARAKYDGWQQKLATMRQAIETLEKRRAAAVETLEIAAGKALESGEVPEFSDMLRDAAVTIQVADAMLPKMREAYREETRRDLSPEPRVVWKPKRLHDAPGGAILSGQYEAHFPE